MPIEISEIRSLIAMGKLRKAINQIIDLTGMYDNAIKNEAIALSARSKDYEKDNALGLKTTDVLGVEKRNIDFAVLGFLNELEERTIKQTKVSTRFIVEINTNKGTEKTSFNSQEDMRLFVRTNKTCFLRVVYKLITGESILIYNNYPVQEGEINKFIEIGDGYTIDAPYGEEYLYVYAQSKAFSDLKTTITKDDYEIILDDQYLTESDKRGIRKKTYYAEASLMILTKA